MPSLLEIQALRNKKAIDKTNAAKEAAKKERAAQMAIRKIEKAITIKRERLMGETICNAMKAHELGHDEIRMLGKILGRRKDTPPDWDLLDDFPERLLSVNLLRSNQPPSSSPARGSNLSE